MTEPLFTFSPTPLEPMDRLRARLGAVPRLFVKRDDALPIGQGGNKVRKLAFVAAEALAKGADTLITCGGVQSNHARVTAAVAARLGLRCLVVANGQPQAVATGNARLLELFGAEVHYVVAREDRTPRMQDLAGEVARRGGRAYVIPLGASVPLGALGFDEAVDELLDQLAAAPDAIVHASSSGGTQAGLVAGCVRRKIPTKVIGLSADASAGELQRVVRELVTGLGRLVGGGQPPSRAAIVVDDSQIGDGYGVPTTASIEAARLFAQTEGLVLDQTYTAKAAAGFLAWLASQEGRAASTAVFWHTGGVPGFFA